MKDNVGSKEAAFREIGACLRAVENDPETGKSC